MVENQLWYKSLYKFSILKIIGCKQTNLRFNECRNQKWDCKTWEFLWNPISILTGLTQLRQDPGKRDWTLRTKNSIDSNYSESVKIESTLMSQTLSLITTCLKTTDSLLWSTRSRINWKGNQNNQLRRISKSLNEPKILKNLFRDGRKWTNIIKRTSKF